MLETLKWLGTVLLIVGVYFSSRNVYPLGPVIQMLGGVAWLIPAIITKDKPLAATNGIMTAIALHGILTTQPVYCG